MTAPTPDSSLRALTEADFERVIALARRIWLSHFIKIGSSAKPTTPLKMPPSYSLIWQIRNFNSTQNLPIQTKLNGQVQNPWRTGLGSGCVTLRGSWTTCPRFQK